MNSKGLEVIFSSTNDSWETPDDLLAWIDPLGLIQIDAAANEFNHKQARWFGPGGEFEDALAETFVWPRGVYWLNPPYSKGLQRKFVEKAHQAAAGGSVVFMLLPARTDTRLFHDLIWQHPMVSKLTFLKGRITFIGADQGAPFPSMVVQLGKLDR